MATTTKALKPIKQNISAALSRDLKQPGSKEKVKVVDDVARKVFTANRDGAVLVFGHKQPDAAYWTGVKHYGSGPTSRIRIRRTAVTAD
jgi:hypothetical protein